MKKMFFWKYTFISSFSKGLVVSYFTPSSVSYMWNYGVSLGFIFMVQFATGVFLSCHYASSDILAFSSVVYISRDVNFGWILRDIHSNGASFFFFCMYVHMMRGLYFGSFFNIFVWYIGILIFFVSMAIAFIGYVLVWGQMSFWAATVITNLFSVIPVIGQWFVCWMWGGFSVSGPTLNRFFSLHFFLPFVLMALIFAHLLSLHMGGSSNPEGAKKVDNISFYPYFIFKDFYWCCLIFFFLLSVVFFSPRVFGEPENYIKANALVTPTHIKPEWYFLSAYAVLRAIPNKSLGVVALAMFFGIFFFIPFFNKTQRVSGQFGFFFKFLFWLWWACVIFLVWIGGKPAEDPFIGVSVVFAFFYFFLVGLITMVRELKSY